jgi:hypothetical protein
MKTLINLNFLMLNHSKFNKNKSDAIPSLKNLAFTEWIYQEVLISRFRCY